MKLAIVKLSALGDIVHAMVALQFIKTARPDIEIDWIVEAHFAGVLADNPHIQRIQPLNLKALKTAKRGLSAEMAKIRRYAAQDYDLVIDAQGLIKSALVARLLSKHSIGFDKHSIRESAAALFYRQTVHCPYHANTIDRNVTVLTKPLNISVSPEQIIQKQAFLYYHTPEQTLDSYYSANQTQVLFVIGSTWPSRNYPKEKYLQIIQRLPANCLISCGSEPEQQAAAWIAERSDAKPLPRLSLNDLKAAIARTDLVIGNDTGPTHMAWALNRPSITLFGPTPISRVYQTPINKILKSSSPVNPYKLNKNDFSIREIEVDTVLGLAEEILAQGSNN
ncbi:lipopolysaccharide heptosyltransferase I [Methylomonas paludis]|uniref:Lipopolysaccharide heptosyltransferase 1 n=1 Tax=Methylomonas paludis TaxID=1173101 RepID=A0A975RAE6_9GAMM|nr:lipopolysaccharide heptosyltransferase I [Methylomonas paludis]QWF71253.1 lipopolysaccharide heptosyltransferase I [Methylomonas paludis]